ncbi:Olfactory receptor 6T1 [Tupaia chinensis]|uniref:Olfactory receptor 6T1 n=1 Tax=Tupaia chinensis TaxID=246437 RepID=L8YC01_TUPCH|nr:Olfactory receptor 6T1 [Tupaia chinensis]
MGPENWTQVTGFVLLGFPRNHILQALLFLGLTVAYVVTATGNLLIIALSWVDHHLHTQMYFFLRNLSFLELSLVSVVVPKMLVITLTGDHTISFVSCIIQSYLCFLLDTTDFFLLAVMSLDRYLAICHPLHYETLMSGRVCSQLVLASWLAGFLWVLCPTILMASLPFCGPHGINHFLVVTVYGSSIFLYIHLSETQSLLFNKGASVLSCIVTPLLNSFIFSLCNNKMKQALGDALRLLQPTAVRKL